eukprot:TRINITY_DN1972_c0_g2_i2.p1 TRINITY_DN1972_c0_g2~~TRINITY_DN1972_c0_g2_i2.p1  ORF type:complete len:124 (+),score=23.39 TRINITY_DN1972_c0_g2_i2:46-417(+)
MREDARGSVNFIFKSTSGIISPLTIYSNYPSHTMETSPSADFSVSSHSKAIKKKRTVPHHKKNGFIQIKKKQQLRRRRMILLNEALKNNNGKYQSDNLLVIRMLPEDCERMKEFNNVVKVELA